MIHLKESLLYRLHLWKQLNKISVALKRIELLIDDLKAIYDIFLGEKNSEYFRELLGMILAVTKAINQSEAKGYNYQIFTSVVSFKDASNS